MRLPFPGRIGALIAQPSRTEARSKRLSGFILKPLQNPVKNDLRLVQCRVRDFPAGAWLCPVKTNISGFARRKCHRAKKELTKIIIAMIRIISGHRLWCDICRRPLHVELNKLLLQCPPFHNLPGFLTPTRPAS